MKLTLQRRTGLAVLLSVLVAGCSFAPEYRRPDAPIPDQYPDIEAVLNSGPGSANEIAPGVKTSSDLGWREFFADERLQALIRLAIVNNRDLRVAVERVSEARAQFGLTDSSRYPTIGAGANAQVTRNPENLRQGGPDMSSISRYYQAGLGMTSFELDFFGRLRNLSDAAFAQYLATAQARRTVHINLVAQVAEAYFRLRTAEQLRDLMERTLESRQSTFNLVQARYQTGVASALDLAQARSQLDTVRVDLSAIARLQAQARNALQLLIGTPLPADLPEPAIFGREQILAGIPVGLPSELLERRPDIMAAEFVLMGANANIGAARAAFFPNISLTGLLGFASPQLGGLFGGDQAFWQFAPSLQVPIFTGGSLQSNLDLAEARRNIAVAQYEQTIQVAFREVADALAGEATFANQLDALRDLEASAAETLRLAQLRYETGIDSFLQVQSAEVDLYTVQQQFLQTGMDSLMNRVELYKALGGGWLEESVVDLPLGKAYRADGLASAATSKR